MKNINNMEAILFYISSGYIKKINGTDHYFISRDGDVFSSYFGYIKKLKTKKNNGYVYVSIGKKITAKIHRLIAIHFIENLENKPQVNHINGIKNDNRIDNLEWVTAKENMAHSINILGNKNSFRHNKDYVGLKGAINGHSKRVIQLDLEGKFINEWEYMRLAADTLKLDPSTITKCCNGKRKSTGGFKFKYV